MAGMTAKDKNGITQVVRMPADGDPTLARIEKIRERDTAVVDTVNDYYASFHDSMEDSYGSWRQTSFTELEKEMRARSAARTRTVLGAAALHRQHLRAQLLQHLRQLPHRQTRRATPAPWAALPPCSRASRNTPTRACTRTR